MSVHVTNQTQVESEAGSLDYARILWQNLARSATVSASTEESTYPADQAQNPDTYSAWKPTAVQAWWLADLGSDQAVNACGIAAHSLGTNQCRIWLETTEGSPTSWVAATDAAEPDDDSPILLLFPSRTTRFWRLMIDGRGSPSAAPVAMPYLSSIYLGTALTMQRTIYGGHTPVTLSRETVLYNAQSRGGQLLGQGIRRVGYVGNASFRYLTAAWYRANFDAFVASARQYPFFFAWRPGDYPDEIAYAWCEEDIRPSNMGVKEFMQVSFAFKAHDTV